MTGSRSVVHEASGDRSSLKPTLFAKPFDPLSPVITQPDPTTEYIDPSGAALDDQTIANLPVLPQLKRLAVERTKVTMAAIEVLQNKHLGLQVSR